jgi:ribosomal-protein-alanine N-acetyltransferase
MSLSEVSLLEFTKLAEEHLDEVMAIEVEAYPESWSIGMFRDEIRSARSHFYVAFLGGVLVGYGGFWLVLDEVHITSVTVRDQYRRRGFGRRIALHLLRKAVELDARRAVLEVRASNLRAQALYTTLGFLQVGLRRGYYAKTNEDAVIMMLELGPAWSAGRLYGEA